MRIAVPVETAAAERRVALVPDSVARLVKAGHQVRVQRGAGAGAFHSDEAYVTAGAGLIDGSSIYEDTDLVAKVRAPSSEEAAALKPGTAVVALLQPASSTELFGKFAAGKVTAFALELVPRITRAQSMDVLSSQATIAGYKAVLLGAAELPKLLPMLTTAAGTLAPSKVFVIGAGVAGLQAIATARRLGASVSGFDIRAAAGKQVKSLGASFLSSEVVSQSAEDKGGYAKAQAEDERQRTLATIHQHIISQDMVITTAQIPNRAAPKLITEEMITAMKPGSVIVDIAADSGGNTTVTRPGETVHSNGVAILTPLNLASTEPVHASQMFSKNVETFINHIAKDGSMKVDLADEITKAMTITHNGELLRKHGRIMSQLEIIQLYVFILAAFVGYQVITRVPPLLHTPLMSATNAISGISLVGSLVAAGSDQGQVATILGFIAVTSATINVVGGFIITDRMLRMFKRTDRVPQGGKK